MQNEREINTLQFASLAFHFTTGSSILIIPSLLAERAKQDAWLAAIVATACGLLLVCLYNALGSRYPDLNLAEYSERVFGKWIGKTVSLLFASFALVLSALVLENIGVFITIEMMPETPIGVIHALMLWVVVLGVFLELKTLGRAAEIFFILVTVIYILTVTLILPHASIENIQPVLAGGIKPVLLGSLTFIGVPFLELVIFLMLYPHVKKTADGKKGFLIGTALSSFWLSLAVLVTILSLSATITELLVFPTYYVVKKINVAEFIQRVEAGLAVLWFVSIFFKTTICFYAGVHALARSLSLRSHRPLVIPLALIVFFLSTNAFKTYAYFYEFVVYIWPFCAATFGLVLPLLLLGGTFIRRRMAGGTRGERPSTRFKS